MSTVTAVQIIDGTVTVTVDNNYSGSVELADYNSDYNSAITDATTKAEKSKSDFESLTEITS